MTVAPCAELEGLLSSDAALRLLFAQVPAALWTTDRALRMTSAGGAALVARGCAPEQYIGMSLHEFYGADAVGPLDQHPSIAAHLRALEGASSTFEVETWGAWWECHTEPLRDPTGQIAGVVAFALDVTARRQAELLRDAAQAELRQANQMLEERVAERTRELSTLLTISDDVASTLELRPLLGLILDQLKYVGACSAAALGIVEGKELVILESRAAGAEERAGAAIGLRIPLDSLGAIWRAIARGEAVIIDDVSADSPLANDFRAALGSRLAESTFNDVRSWLVVPLAYRGRVIGMMSQSYRQPDYYARHHAEFALAIAHQAAVALENARLYTQAQEEARKTAALARIASSVALGGPLEAALNAVARNVVEAVSAVACSLLVAIGEPPRMRLLGAYGLPAGYVAGINQILDAGDQILSAESYHEPGLQRVQEVRAYVLARPAYAPIHRFMHDVAWDVMITLPSIYQGRHVARLNFYHLPDHEPGPAEIAFLAAIADQAAIAIENARLYAEVEATAALEERQRLARELHDSVSQALYGIVLGAETARAYLDVDPARVAKPLEYVRSLANAGLAEMKALIFELRPESLENEGLVAALSKQVAALRARYQLDVTGDLCEEPAVAIGTKESLYRIAQESLHNVVRHAQATHVVVRLAGAEGGVLLEVRDDGGGFDPSAGFPGHLGLQSMRERVERAGGSLEVASAPGAGTLIRAVIPHS